MKKVNFKLLSLVFFLFAFCSVSVFAQKEEDKSKKKVVIVKKIKDKDGKVKVERIEKEGEEAEEYIKKLKITDEDGKEIDIDIKMDGDMMIDSDGKQKRVEIIEIDDIEELSEELKKELRDLNVEIDILDDGNAERIIKVQALGDELEMFEMEDMDMIMITDDNENVENINVNKDNDETTIEIKTKDGETKKFKYKGEMPDDVKKELEEMGLKVGSNGFMHHPHQMQKRMKIAHGGNSNKAFLGVILGDKSDLGVKVDDVVEGSGAEKAGLKAGDIITAIDGNTVKSSKELIAALKDKKPNDNVSISYIRGDDTDKVTATLGENKKSGHANVWVSGDGDDHFVIKRQPSIFVSEDNENIETIDIEKDNDKTILKIKEKGKDAKTFEWEGEMPEDIKKQLEEMDVKVAKMSHNPMKLEKHHKMMKIKGGVNKAFLGVVMGDEKSDKGVHISKVVEESAAEAAGLKAGDIITAIDGNEIKDYEGLVGALKDKKVGDKINIQYLRDDKSNSTEATLTERKGYSWTSEDGNEFKIKIDEDFDFDFEGIDFDGGKIEINDGDENVFFFKQAGEGGESRPFIGILMEDDDETENGVTLLGTVDGSAAEKAGLVKGDIVTSVDGQNVNAVKDVTDALEGKKVGDKIKVAYTRDGKAQSADIELGERTYSNSFVYEYDFDGLHDMKKKYKTKKIIIIKSDKDEEGEEEEEKVIVRKSMSGDNLEGQRVKVFPNPTKDQLTVQFQAEGNPYTIVIQDVSGKEIHREEVKDGMDYDKQLDISQAASGMVVVTINQGDDVYRMKVLKQ